MAHEQRARRSLDLHAILRTAGSASEFENRGCAVAVGARRETPRKVERPFARLPGPIQPAECLHRQELSLRRELAVGKFAPMVVQSLERRAWSDANVTARGGDERRLARQRIRRIGWRRRPLRAREPCRCPGSRLPRRLADGGTRRNDRLRQSARANDVPRSGVRAAGGLPETDRVRNVLGSTPRPHAGRERHREHEAGHGGRHAGDQPLPQRRSSRNVADNPR